MHVNAFVCVDAFSYRLSRSLRSDRHGATQHEQRTNFETCQERQVRAKVASSFKSSKHTTGETREGVIFSLYLFFN